MDGVRRVWALLFIGLVAVAATCQETPETPTVQATPSAAGLSVGIAPNGVLPLYPNGSVFGIGPGVDLQLRVQPRELPMFLGLDVGYNLAAVPLVTGRLHSAHLLIGAGLHMPIGSQLVAEGIVRAGYAYQVLLSDTEGGADGNVRLDLSGGLRYSLTPSISVGVHAGYVIYFSLFGGVRAGLDLRYALSPSAAASVRRERPDRTDRPAPLTDETISQAEPETDSEPEAVAETATEETAAVAGLPPRGRTGIGLSDIETDDLFPVFHSYYYDHPFGSVTVVNESESTATGIRVSFFVDRYMDVATSLNLEEALGPGTQVEVPLRALFTNEILDVIEQTRVAAEILVSYELDGVLHEESYDHIMTVQDRNAMTWDDDNKAASFVTPKDPTVLSFARNVAGIVGSTGSQEINYNLRTAMGILQALDLYGMNYAIDPDSSYIELSETPTAVDYLQFPRQTLAYHAGDCDDLAIGYSALLEAANVHAAFVTIPGHIYVAFALGMSPGDARSTFARPDELIFTEDESWIPIEVTILEEGFLRAWEIGAKQWLEHSARGQTGFFPLATAWETYPPVGLTARDESVPMPRSEDIALSYLSELTFFIDREIFPQVAELRRRIEESENSYRYENRLGVLFARYGLHDRAKTEFEKVLSKREYVPALVNLGNIEFMGGEMREALNYYQRASVAEPDHTGALLGVARANHELQNYGTVADSYDRLRDLDPDTAERFAYLSFRGEEATRAAEIGGVRDIVVWDEEEEEE